MGRKNRRPQRSAAARTLPLPTFEPQISRERAFEIVRRIPIGTYVVARQMKCRKPTCHCADGPGHGPYWQAHGLGGRALYIGTDERKAELDAAWRMVGAELAAAQANVDATPEGRALARLLALLADTPRTPQKASEPAPAAKESAA